MTRLRLVLVLLGLLCGGGVVQAEEKQKWPGVDEAVVEKVAQQHGRPAREPLINTDQGDLLLFLFLLAGAAGGFAAGYYWRLLMEQRRCPPAPTADRPEDRLSDS